MDKSRHCTICGRTFFASSRKQLHCGTEACSPSKPGSALYWPSDAEEEDSPFRGWLLRDGQTLRREQLRKLQKRSTRALKRALLCPEMSALVDAFKEAQMQASDGVFEENELHYVAGYDAFQVGVSTLFREHALFTKAKEALDRLNRAWFVARKKWEKHDSGYQS